jgi:hypothetical protein
MNFHKEIKDKIDHAFSFILHNLECTSCKDYDWMAMAPDYHESNSSETPLQYSQKGWNLYIKEFETYRAFVLWHPLYQKDWSQLFPYKETISLFDENGNYILSLESVGIQNDFCNWVPSEKDQNMYERILDQPKPLHSSIHAHYVGTYSIQF